MTTNNKINSFKTDGEHRRFREDDLDTYMGVKKEKQERLTVGNEMYLDCDPNKVKDFLRSHLSTYQEKLKKIYRMKNSFEMLENEGAKYTEGFEKAVDDVLEILTQLNY